MWSTHSIPANPMYSAWSVTIVVPMSSILWLAVIHGLFRVEVHSNTEHKRAAFGNLCLLLTYFGSCLKPTCMMHCGSLTEVLSSSPLGDVVNTCRQDEKNEWLDDGTEGEIIV